MSKQHYRHEDRSNNLMVVYVARPTNTTNGHKPNKNYSRDGGITSCNREGLGVTSSTTENTKTTSSATFSSRNGKQESCDYEVSEINRERIHNSCKYSGDFESCTLKDFEIRVRNNSTSSSSSSSSSSSTSSEVEFPHCGTGDLAPEKPKVTTTTYVKVKRQIDGQEWHVTEDDGKPSKLTLSGTGTKLIHVLNQDKVHFFGYETQSNRHLFYIQGSDVAGTSLSFIDSDTAVKPESIIDTKSDRRGFTYTEDPRTGLRKLRPTVDKTNTLAVCTNTLDEQIVIESEIDADGWIFIPQL